MVRSKCSSLFAVAIDLSAACLPACLLLPHLCSCKTVLVDPMTMYHTSSSSTTTVQCYYYTHEPALQLLIQMILNCGHQQLVLVVHIFFLHLFLGAIFLPCMVGIVLNEFLSDVYCKHILLHYNSPTLNLTFSFKM